MLELFLLVMISRRHAGPEFPVRSGCRSGEQDSDLSPGYGKEAPSGVSIVAKGGFLVLIPSQSLQGDGSAGTVCWSGDGDAEERIEFESFIRFFHLVKGVVAQVGFLLCLLREGFRGVEGMIRDR